MPFKLNKATVSLSNVEIESIIKEAVNKEGYKAGKITFNTYEMQRGPTSISATIEVEFPALISKADPQLIH